MNIPEFTRDSLEFAAAVLLYAVAGALCGAAAGLILWVLYVVVEVLPIAAQVLCATGMIAGLLVLLYEVME